jgi:glutathione reductase (NADPH)
MEVDAVLCAAGRRPNLEGLGLENTSVKLTSHGTIEVDEHFRTAEQSIFALGDVIGGMELTPVALAEGMAFARREFAGIDRAVQYEFIPTAVFSQPNIGTVGFTESEAQMEFGEITLYKSTFRPMKHTISGRDEKTFMKLIVDDASDRVVGVHMVGPDAGEIMQGIAIAHEGRRHQSRLRQHDRYPPDRRRGIRHHARTLGGLIHSRLGLEL